MKKIFCIFLIIITCLLSFISGILYCTYQNKKFYDAYVGISLKENRKKWGGPDRIDKNKYEIVDTYKKLLPFNEYKFFYNKKDSLMTNSWKEY